MPRLCPLVLVACCSPGAAFSRQRVRSPAAAQAADEEEGGFLSFPSSFKFGAATAAYQIEGAATEDGRGASVYDVNLHRSLQPNGDVADDHYHRFKDDVALMAKLGLEVYRFSISWSRVLPRGTGDLNPVGVRFYSNLIDELLRHGIQPWVTMFHWDTPQALHEQFGAWLGPKERIVPAFANYSRTLFRLYGDRVKHWITLNEPWCVAKMYMLPNGGNWLKANPLDAPYRAGHNLLLAHSEAVRIYRAEFQTSQQGTIGITLNNDWNEPKDSSKHADVEAAQRANDFMFGWFAEPVFFGHYPTSMRLRLGKRLPYFTRQEMELLRNSTDFLGVNNYFAKYVTPATSVLNANLLAGPDVGVQLLEDHKWERDDMSRPITPWGFKKFLVYVQQRYAPAGGIVVTENGVAAEPEDQIREDKLHEPSPRPWQGSSALQQPEDWDHETFEDPRRVRYLRAHLAALHDAREAGADVRAYFVWSLMDNFEWSNYHSRFGIVHVDYDTQKRTLKRSARVYASIIKDRGFRPLPEDQYAGERF